jgi:hypothetical protein
MLLLYTIETRFGILMALKEFEKAFTLLLLQRMG